MFCQLIAGLYEKTVLYFYLILISEALNWSLIIYSYNLRTKSQTLAKKWFLNVGLNIREAFSGNEILKLFRFIHPFNAYFITILSFFTIYSNFIALRK